MSPLRWTVLGAGTAVPHPQRSPSGHLLTVGARHFLIDMGSGTLSRLARVGLPWTSLEALFLSHRHLDHTLDLPGLLFASRIPGHGRAAPLPVHMGPGMRGFVAGLEKALGRWMQPVGFEVQWREHSGAEPALELGGGLRALLRPVAHDRTSLGMRFALPGGATVAYSGDSDYCPSLVQLCQGARLAVLECSSPTDQKIPGHMTPREVAQVAQEAQVGRVLLVHTYPGCDGVDLAAQVAHHGYHGPVEVARDGARIDLE